MMGAEVMHESPAGIFRLPRVSRREFRAFIGQLMITPGRFRIAGGSAQTQQIVRDLYVANRGILLHAILETIISDKHTHK